MTTSGYVDIAKAARQTICEIGYDRAKYGFDGHTCGVWWRSTSSRPTSPRASTPPTRTASAAVRPYDLVGAGDQGMMFGYACRETDELMPMPVMLAHRLGLRLAAVRKDGSLPYLRPDGKTQVSVRYEQDAHGRIRPVEITGVLISTQHAEDADPRTRILPDLIEQVIEPTLPRTSSTTPSCTSPTSCW